LSEVGSGPRPGPAIHAISPVFPVFPERTARAGTPPPPPRPRRTPGTAQQTVRAARRGRGRAHVRRAGRRPDPATAADVTPRASAISAYDAVDPFIGTELDPAPNKGNSAYGNTWPGATTPFGMVQSSPTTYRSSDGDQKGGYEYSADKIRGFGRTRLSGTGCEGRFSAFDFPVLRARLRERGRDGHARRDDRPGLRGRDGGPEVLRALPGRGREAPTCMLLTTCSDGRRGVC